MTNIRTIADIQQQDQHSVQSIILRGSQGLELHGMMYLEAFGDLGHCLLDIWATDLTNL